MTITQLLNALRARWKIAVLIVSVGTVLVLAYSLFMPKKYEANATIVVDGRSADPIGAYGTSAGMSSLMATQFDIIRSDRVAKKALDRTGLLKSEALRLAWEQRTGSQGSYVGWAAAFVKQNLNVKPSRESNVIEIGYEAEDPKFAAAMANAFAQSYVDVALELRVSPARQYSTYFDESLSRAKSRLDDSRTALSDFLKQNDLISSDERFDVELNKLNELSQQAVMLRSLAADSSSRAAQNANGRADKLQDVINNPVINSIKSNIVQEESRLEQLSATLGTAHPQVRQSRAALAELKDKLSTETRRVADSVNVTSVVNRARETEVLAAYEAQRKRVLKLKEARDHAAMLTKDVQSAEQAYDTIAMRLNQASLEGQASLANVHLLTPADEPSLASKPNIMLNTIVGFVVSGVLGLVVAFVSELLWRKIRSDEDIEELLGEAPLASLSSVHADGAKSLLRISALKSSSSSAPRLPGNGINQRIAAE